MKTMRGRKLFDHTKWKSKKGVHVLRCLVFTENIDIVKSKKRYRPSCPQMFCFSMKVSVKKKKVFIFRDDKALHFLRGPRFQPA